MIPQPPPSAPVPLPTPQRYDPTQDALRYTLLLWSHINRLRRAFGFHHASHEPGGLDEIQMPLGGLVDVALGTAVADGAVLAEGGVTAAGAGGCFEVAGGAVPEGEVAPQFYAGGIVTLTGSALG